MLHNRQEIKILQKLKSNQTAQFKPSYLFFFTYCDYLYLLLPTMSMGNQIIAKNIFCNLILVKRGLSPFLFKLKEME